MGQGFLQLIEHARKPSVRRRSAHQSHYEVEFHPSSPWSVRTSRDEFEGNWVKRRIKRTLERVQTATCNNIVKWGRRM